MRTDLVGRELDVGVVRIMVAGQNFSQKFICMSSMSIGTSY